MKYTVVVIFKYGGKDIAEYGDDEKAATRCFEIQLNRVLRYEANNIFMVTLCKGCKVMRGIMCSR